MTRTDQSGVGWSPLKRLGGNGQACWWVLDRRSSVWPRWINMFVTLSQWQVLPLWSKTALFLKYTVLITEQSLNKRKMLLASLYSSLILGSSLCLSLARPRSCAGWANQRPCVPPLSQRHDQLQNRRSLLFHQRAGVRGVRVCCGQTTTYQHTGQAQKLWLSTQHGSPVWFLRIFPRVSPLSPQVFVDGNDQLLNLAACLAGVFPTSEHKLRTVLSGQLHSVRCRSLGLRGVVGHHLGFSVSVYAFSHSFQDKL